MRVVGIVAEYNPLHEGHLFHLQSAKKETGADYCVCVLSSNFVQRGEPSIFSKWARTRMALDIGADLVLELPVVLSSASAEYFASGAVRVLDSLNCVDYLCFGSEEGKIENLEKAAAFLVDESDEFKTELRRALDSGMSFAAARQLAVSRCSDIPESISSVLDKPNNILSIEYMKALRRFGCGMKPVTIKRVGQGYNSLERANSFSSATAIRQHLSQAIGSGKSVEEDTFLKSNLPATSLEIMADEISMGRGPVFPEAFETLLLHLVRSTSLKVLKTLPYMEEGLENRLKDAAMNSVSLSELISSAVTVRYPASRIRRILCALLTGITGEFLDEIKANGYAQYIRVLGFNENGRQLLARVKKKVHLPLLTRPVSYNKLESRLAQRLFEYESKATDAYVLAYPNAKLREGGSEFRAQPIYKK